MEHSAKAGLRGGTGAPILETLCKSGPPRGRGGADPWNTLQKRGSAGPRRRQPLDHYAKESLREAAGAPVLETLCKSGPRRGAGWPVLPLSRILGAQAPGQASPFSGKNSRSEFVCFLVQFLLYESNFPRSASLLVMLVLALATVLRSGGLGLLRAAILETLCKSGPRRGRGTASP